MEKLKIVLGESGQVLGTWNLPVYWTLPFGRQDLLEMYKQGQIPFEESWFDPIVSTKRSDHFIFSKEHFIIRRKGSGHCTVEDRNSPPATYLNNVVVGKDAVKINENDVISIPLRRNGQLISLFLQLKYFFTDPGSQVRQLHQCSNTGKMYLVYWEEEASSRRHFAVKTAKLEGNQDQTAQGNFKNLRPTGEVPCPHCGNMQSVYCVVCKEFICYDGHSETVKCAGCNNTYSLKEDHSGNVDVKSF